jgi:hypothetical protein
VVAGRTGALLLLRSRLRLVFGDDGHLFAQDEVATAD